MEEVKHRKHVLNFMEEISNLSARRFADELNSHFMFEFKPARLETPMLNMFFKSVYLPSYEMRAIRSARRKMGFNEAF